MIDSISEDDALLFLKKTPAWLHNGIEIFAATQRMKSRLVRELARRIQSQCSGKTKTPLDWRSDLGITALMAAAGQGPAGTDSVLALLEHGADPSLVQLESPASFWRGGAFRKPARGFPSMDFAASSNACRSITLLAQKAPELISTPGSGGLLPIARAAKKGNVGAIRLLKESDSAWAMDDAGFSAIAHACSQGHSASLAELLEQDPGTLSQWLAAPFELSPMALAIGQGRSEKCVDVLIGHASQFPQIAGYILWAHTPREDSGLALAASCGATRVFDALLEPTLAAARSDELRLEVLKRCLSPSSDHCATASSVSLERDLGGRAAIAHVTRIVAKIPTPPKHHYPWHRDLEREPSLNETKAARKFLAEMAQRLRSSSAGNDLSAQVASLMASTPNSILIHACGLKMITGSMTLLHALAQHGLVEPFEAAWLLAGPSAIFELDTRGWTPFCVAAAHGHGALCSLVMKRARQSMGPIEAMEDIHGRSPLLVALEQRHFGVASVLLSESARAPAILGRAASLVGKTPLMAASASGDLKMIHLLIEKAGLGASDFSAVDLCGNTALHAAVAATRPEAIAMLASQCDPNRANGLGESALHLACKLGFVQAIELLAPLAESAAGVDNSGFGPVETCAMREGPAYALATVAKWIDPRRPIMPKACHAVSGLAQIIPNSSTLARLAGRDSAADILDAVALGWESGVYPPTRPLPALPPVREASAAVEPSHVLPEGPLSAESSIDNSRALKESARIALMKMSKASSSESKVARKSMTARSSTRMPR